MVNHGASRHAVTTLLQWEQLRIVLLAVKWNDYARLCHCHLSDASKTSLCWASHLGSQHDATRSRSSGACNYRPIAGTQRRVAIFWGGALNRRGSGVSAPENFWNSLCDLVHFDAVWWQLFVGRRTRYICNFAIKIEPVCQLQCLYDCRPTVVLFLLRNHHALKSAIFGVPGLVLPARRSAWYRSGTSREIRDGWQP